MSFALLKIREEGCVVERDSAVSPIPKRDYRLINRDGVRYAISDIPQKEARNDDGRMKKPKKFRSEWMEEAHLRDWLQPHPGDDTMCICTACDIHLRCGKSELEKHATGLKHTKKVEEMKVDSSQESEDSQVQAHNNEQTTRFEHFPNRTDDSVWIPVTSLAELPMDDLIEEEVIDDEATGFIKPQQKEKSCDTKLTEALVKLFEFADGKVDLSRKRLEMLQEEHALKLQILEKELRLKALEVEIKETELRKLKLEAMQSGLKENQIQQSSQLTISDHQLHVINDQHLQEVLQAQLQHFQAQIEHHQSQEPKVNDQFFKCKRKLLITKLPTFKNAEEDFLKKN